MLKEYTREQLQKLYKELPEELQDAIYSEKTADSIYDICERNDIEEKSIVAKLVGRVFLGLIPPDEFQQILTKELKIGELVAKEVTREITRFIFYPVKPLLEQLHKTEPEESEKTSILKKTLLKRSMEEKPKPSAQKDEYRESFK